ncbi:MAG: dihydrolipoyl dehydrogenase [Proteocatella sp.]
MDIKLKTIMGKDKAAVIGKMNISVGDNIEAGQVLLQLETKKGNSPMKSEVKGIIEELFVEEGQTVELGQVLMKVKSEAGDVPKIKLDYFGGMINGKKEDVSTEILVIGGGPGGYVSAIYAAKNGKKVVLVERKALGGTCLNEGCIPTKAIVKSSEVYNHIVNAKDFGVIVKEAKADMEKVIDRKNAIRDTLVSGIDYLMGKNDIRVIKGTASFLEDKKVMVKSGKDEYTIEAQDVIIATGSSTSNIKIPGIDNKFVMNSTQALDCKEDMKSITIIGGGVIGMEFAFIYSNFGMRVNVVEYFDRVLTMVDSDVSKEIQDISRNRGIGIHTGSKVTKIGRDENGQAVVFFEKDAQEKFIVSDKVLVAIGREPNIEGLDFEKAGILSNENGKGIAVDSAMRTSAENIYAIGDVNCRMQLAHVASHEGMVAVDNILGKNKEMDYSVVPNVIFTSPEIANVGITEDVAIRDELNIKVSKFPFGANGKALTMGESEGFIKLIKNLDTGKIIGGAIIGPEASALISSLTLIINHSISEEEVVHTIFAHPTTGEAIHEAALELGIGAMHYHE